MSSARNQHEGAQEYVPIPWNDTEICVEQLTCSGRDVTPMIRANTEKGFFCQAGDYTTYRRNYFAALVSYELHHPFTTGNLLVTHEGREYQVKAFGMRLSAAVDQPNGKVIELVQHTPKRDNGPKTKVEIVKMDPTPGVPTSFPSYQSQAPSAMPDLPFQRDSATGFMAGMQSSGQAQYNLQQSTVASLALPGQYMAHVFDRVQFKNATANNGKRRASQQYFLLKVELWADIRNAFHEDPAWVKIAQKVSTRLIVRGRSPSHYAPENPRRNGRGAGGSGAGGRSGGGSGTAGQGYHSYPGPGLRPRQLGYDAKVDGSASGMYHTHTMNAPYLSPPFLNSTGMPSLMSSPIENLNSIDVGPFGTFGALSNHGNFGCYNNRRTARYAVEDVGLYDMAKVKRLEDGSHRDSHHVRHRHVSTAHGIPTTTPSPNTSPGFSPASFLSPGSLQTDFSSGDEKWIFSPSMQ